MRKLQHFLHHVFPPTHFKTSALRKSSIKHSWSSWIILKLITTQFLKPFQTDKLNVFNYKKTETLLFAICQWLSHPILRFTCLIPIIVLLILDVKTFLRYFYYFIAIHLHCFEPFLNWLFNFWRFYKSLQISYAEVSL